MSQELRGKFVNLKKKYETLKRDFKDMVENKDIIIKEKENIHQLKRDINELEELKSKQVHKAVKNCASIVKKKLDNNEPSEILPSILNLKDEIYKKIITDTNGNIIKTEKMKATVNGNISENSKVNTNSETDSCSISSNDLNEIRSTICDFLLK